MTTGVQIGEPIERSSLLYRSKVEYSDWCANLYQGCSHDCKYCFARNLAKRTGRIKADEEWRVVHPAGNALELLDRELPKYAGKIDEVHLCFTCDPFVYDPLTDDCHEDIAFETLAVISTINAAGIPVSTLTKGVYPLDDEDWLDPDNRYGITVVTLNEDFRKEWEPGAAPLERRIASLMSLAESGARTWVSIEPYPTPNIDPSAVDIVPLLEAVSFVDEIVFGKMNYVPRATAHARANPDFFDGVSSDVMAWCRANHKDLLIKQGTPHAGRYPARDRVG